MSIYALLAFCVVGLLLVSIGGFGLHVLDTFSGRRLEAYCRSQKKSDRYRQILLRQESALKACRYLYLMGMTTFVICSTLSIALARGWTLVASGDGTGLAFSTLFSCIAIETVFVTLVSVWLPRLVERLSAASVLYHIWPGLFFITRLFEPITLLDAFFDTIGQRLTDRENESDDEEELEDEIRTLVATGAESGLVRDGIPTMIQKILSLDERNVAQIMTRRADIDGIDIETPYEEVVRRVAEKGRTRIPVYERDLDQIVGILFVKDLFTAIADGSIEQIDEEKRIRSVLREVKRIPARRQINELLSDFLNKRNHMAIVVGEVGKTIGLITIEDALEEIVGEIADEHDDVPEALYEIEGGGNVLASGLAEVADLNSEFQFSLPISDNYDTIAGLIIWYLKRIPGSGEFVELEDMRLEVTAANARRVQKVRIATKLSDSATMGAPNSDASPS